MKRLQHSIYLRVLDHVSYKGTDAPRTELHIIVQKEYILAVLVHGIHACLSENQNVRERCIDSSKFTPRLCVNRRISQSINSSLITAIVDSEAKQLETYKFVVRIPAGYVFFGCTL